MATSLRQVSATDAWASLPDLRCSRVSILNDTGAVLEIRLAGDPGNDIAIKDGRTVAIPVVSNAKEIQIQAEAAADGVQLVIE